MTLIRQAPGALPGLGHTLPLLRNHTTFLKCLPSYGDLVAIRVGPFKVLVACTPELTRQVFADDKTFDKGGFVFDRSREILGNGLGSCPHSDHRRQRRLCQPAFHRSRLPAYARVATDHAIELTDSWRDGQTVDVHADMLRTAGRVITASIFTGMHPSVVDELVESTSTFTATGYWRMVLPSAMARIPFPINRRHERARAVYRRIANAALAEYRSEQVDRGDLLSMLLATAGDGDGLSDAELADQIMIFLGAGHETVANTVTWALHLLSNHRDVEDQLHTEVDTVLAGQPATAADLPALEVTSRIIRETLRLYPGTVIVTRCATVDTHLGEHAIPAGSTIVASSYLIHHRPELYPDPERFDPDRDPHQYTRDAFIPFSSGARKCIGDSFAINEATILLATIATRWRLESIAGQKVSVAPAITMRPRKLRMLATARPAGQRSIPGLRRCRLDSL